jgi:IS1 family transposase
LTNCIGKKEGHKRPSEANDDSIGDCYTWIAIESVTKLVLAFSVGRWTLHQAMDLMLKLRRATSDQRFQLTTDGLQAYLPAVDEMLGDRVEYANW